MRNSCHTKSICMVLLAGALIGLASLAISAENKPAKIPPVPSALADAVNQFGLEVLGVATHDNVNALISPLSIHAVLSMTSTGAAGQTATQMQQVLHLTALTEDDTQKQWASMLDVLSAPTDGQTLKIANALWGRTGLNLKPEFLARSHNTFRATAGTLDFTQPKTLGVINGWVAQNTQGMIPKMLDSLSATTQLMLANAVYFKADWNSPFNHDSTSQSPFTRNDGSKVDVAMMHSASSLPFAQNTSLQATRLSYKGQATAYYIFLPKPGVSLEAARASLLGNGLAALTHAMDTQEAARIILSLPKLDISFGADLGPVLTQLGMQDAFNAMKSNFSKITDEKPLAIGAVLHKTRLKVDEQGSEAAAATVSGMMTGTAVPRNPPVLMQCDHPYLFAITDQSTGAMLMLGAVNDPNQH